MRNNFPTTGNLPHVRFGFILTERKRYYIGCCEKIVFRFQPDDFDSSTIHSSSIHSSQSSSEQFACEFHPSSTRRATAGGNFVEGGRRAR